LIAQTEITNIFHPVDEPNQETQNNFDTHSTIELDPDGWYAQSEVKDV